MQTKWREEDCFMYLCASRKAESQQAEHEVRGEIASFFLTLGAMCRSSSRLGTSWERLSPNHLSKPAGISFSEMSAILSDLLLTTSSFDARRKELQY